MTKNNVLLALGPESKKVPGVRTRSEDSPRIFPYCLPGEGRDPYVDGPRPARVVQQKRFRSIAVICPAFVRGTVAAGPDGVRGSGPKHVSGVEDTDGSHGLSRSSDRPITILLLSLQAPECGERFRPPADGGRSRRSPAWPRRCGPSCWPARSSPASSACAPAIAKATAKHRRRAAGRRPRPAGRPAG